MNTFQLIGRIVVGHEDYVIEPQGYSTSEVRVYGLKVGKLANGTPRTYLFDSLQDAVQWIDGAVEDDSKEHAVTRESRLACEG